MRPFYPLHVLEPSNALLLARSQPALQSSRMLPIKENVKGSPDLKLAPDTFFFRNLLQAVSLCFRPGNQLRGGIDPMLLVPALERLELDLDVAAIACCRSRTSIPCLDQRDGRRVLGITVLEDMIGGGNTGEALADDGNVDLLGDGGR